ncbi:hypothetical protein [Paragemmobacter ruber]|uniref:Uncharacterized protein n=1 Tax=Paragemmobacter ruber TaxID=1985673 RepID=A0ABW9YA62_9RHOB|nr:hypothetical protein [Rhodobacter ruber]NBE08629.1 hypothetical protein [Rhodobacter ruber]
MSNPCRMVLTAVALSLVASATWAQGDDGMEQQRCVWSCLANSPGAASAEYNACVAQLCEALNPGSPTADPAADPAPSGLTVSPRPPARPTGATADAHASAAAPPPMPQTPVAQNTPQDAAPSGWTFGPGADGAGMFAGVADPVSGRRIDWLCAKGRPSVLALSPYEGEGRVIFTVDTRPREVQLTVEGAAAFAPIGFADPLFLHIASGPEFTVADPAGQVLGRFSMDGAPLAIGQAEGRCR